MKFVVTRRRPDQHHVCGAKGRRLRMWSQVFLHSIRLLKNAPASAEAATRRQAKSFVGNADLRSLPVYAVTTKDEGWRRDE